MEKHGQMTFKWGFNHHWKGDLPSGMHSEEYEGITDGRWRLTT